MNASAANSHFESQCSLASKTAYAGAVCMARAYAARMPAGLTTVPAAAQGPQAGLHPQHAPSLARLARPAPQTALAAAARLPGRIRACVQEPAPHASGTTRVVTPLVVLQRITHAVKHSRASARLES